jgi:hypothetical protein
MRSLKDEQLATLEVTLKNSAMLPWVRLYPATQECMTQQYNGCNGSAQEVMRAKRWYYNNVIKSIGNIL